jgi:hypothetical protein
LFFRQIAWAIKGLSNGLGKEIAVLLHAFGIGEQPIVTPDCNGEGLYLPP